jgi:hypothetical protein
LGNILKKIAPKSFGQYFSEKNAPSAKKYCPNGEISPNLVTLIKSQGKSLQPGGFELEVGRA